MERANADHDLASSLIRHSNGHRTSFRNCRSEEESRWIPLPRSSWRRVPRWFQEDSCVQCAAHDLIRDKNRSHL